MNIQMHIYKNGSWVAVNPLPAPHTHTISDLPNNLLTTNTTQTITGKKTITTNDLNMDGSSVAYIRPATTGGWARGFWWKTRSTDTPANTRIGGIGVLGSNQSVSYFYIGYGASPWSNPAVEVRSGYTNIRNGLKLNGEDVATITYLNNALSPYYNQTQVDNLLSGYSIKSHTHSGVYEPVFTKNTAFNKNFGTGNGDVARGDHTHTISNITNLQSTLDKKIEPQSSSSVSGNCNNVTTTSIYQGSWTLNTPPSGSYGTLITTQTTHGSSSYLRQIYLSENSTKMYTRVKSTTWGAWQQIGTMSLSGTTLNITL